MDSLFSLSAIRAPAVALYFGQGADKNWYKLAKMFTLSLKEIGDPALVWGFSTAPGILIWLFCFWKRAADTATLIL